MEVGENGIKGVTYTHLIGGEPRSMIMGFVPIEKLLENLSEDEREKLRHLQKTVSGLLTDGGIISSHGDVLKTTQEAVTTDQEGQAKIDKAGLIRTTASEIRDDFGLDLQQYNISPGTRLHVIGRDFAKRIKISMPLSSRRMGIGFSFPSQRFDRHNFYDTDGLKRAFQNAGKRIFEAEPTVKSTYPLRSYVHQIMIETSLNAQQILPQSSLQSQPTRLR